MKFKTTKKVINEVYRNIICVGYADLSYLLTYIEPMAYTCGVYGWNADIYNINGKVHKYNMMARDINHDTNDYVEIKEKLNNLINEFMEEVL